MNVGSSNCSSVDFTDEEQNLIFTWITDLEGGEGGSQTATDYVYRKLRDYGFCRTKEQVSPSSHSTVSTSFVFCCFLNQVTRIVTLYNLSFTKDNLWTT